MKIAKPELSALEKKRANELWAYMKDKEYCTKPEIAKFLGWEWSASTERKVRDLVSILSHVKPIISTSDKNKGYKLAKDSGDLELVKHTWAELSSRIEELQKRITPLIHFMDKHNANLLPINR